MLPYSSSEVPAHSPKRCMYLIGLPPIGQPAEETFFIFIQVMLDKHVVFLMITPYAAMLMCRITRRTSK